MDFRGSAKAVDVPERGDSGVGMITLLPLRLATVAIRDRFVHPRPEVLLRGAVPQPPEAFRRRGHHRVPLAQRLAVDLSVHRGERPQAERSC